MKPLSVMLSMLAIGITSSAAMAQSANLPNARLVNASLANASLPNVSPANSDLANRGAYIARAADCVACHGEDYTGGSPIETPMGAIYSTNITPSKRYGIGNYTEADLKNVLQKGRAPEYMLYPAMPYPSYNGMTNEDISALFAYLQTVPAVDEAIEHKTDLPFPFNFRSLMWGWNLINVPSTENRDGLTQTQQRGEYLVNNLAHCGTCHTPRNSTMGFDKSMYLSGAPLGNWHAPNITPNDSSGIGSWSEQDIVTYLRTGELDQRAYAGGPMGEVVAHSTRYLKDEDLGAIASYLKAVPAIQTDDKVTAVDVARLPSPASESITHDLLEQKDYLAQAKASVGAGSNSPEMLYLATCGSCHGVDGYAQPDARYAPIVGLSSIRRDKPDALINVIVHGIDGATNTSPKMPGFSEDLNSEQIAGIANYVRVNFGGLARSDVSTADVDRVMTAKPDQPFLIKYAGLLATLGIIVALIIIVFIIRGIIRSRRRG
ncbi:cytochrome c [Psychrobacter sp. LV10R520-6]|uniref:cytochrome c n=1 Tax=Psychrobacter sp. LV10R520-6 TaxID=1415574 RepID=UPI0024C5B7C7|nr:cytochrome c [Psychrobacter sp. LV10R520-6]SNT69596.1 Cytochrome c, mono- and diheme variants [Psychrobacter sp. LV10R520-6]